MPVINDDEFGKVVVRRSARASQVRLRVAPDGTLRASLPLYAPLFLVKRLIKSSREQLREMQKQSSEQHDYRHGMQIGKSHHIEVRLAPRVNITHHGRRILVELPKGKTIHDGYVTQKVKEAVAAALRLEAKSYLPRRLAHLAEEHGYSYERVRFSHASGRWGSCSSNGTISLNIALMKLPFELIDYVIIHELAHTKEMNHSHAFWHLVGKADPAYQAHRKELREHTPSI